MDLAASDVVAVAVVGVGAEEEGESAADGVKWLRGSATVPS